MKNRLLFTSLVLSAYLVPAQEAELPKEKGEKRLSYYHDSTPLNAFHSIYSDIYIHKWLDAPHDGMEPIPQAEQDKISDNFLRHCRENQLYAELLDGLIYREKWDEAIAVAPEAVAFYRAKAPTVQKLRGFDLANYGLSHLNWANALLGAGRREEAKAKLVETAKIGWAGYYNGGRATYPCPGGTAQARLYWFEGDRLDKLGLPKWTDFKPFPEPQKAKYEERFVPAAKLSIVLRGVDETDGRIALLKLKLRKRGFDFAFAKEAGEGYALEIALDPANCRVRREEGYTLDATEGGTTIVGHDAQGVLWGIVSFIQILDPEKHQMRLCSIEDWPACLKRGYLGSSWVGNAEFSIFNKLNYVTLKPHPLQYAGYTPLNLMAATEQAKEFNDLGLTLFYDNRPMTMDCAWPLCWNVTLARMIADAKMYAKCGVGLYFGYDDARYWESAAYTKEDQATGLKPSDYDAPFLAKLYNAVKAEYPNFKMQFCPPFYWGPNAGHPYPDDRDKYLRSLAKHLPEEVDVFWSGERVGSHTKTPLSVRWFSGRIGRKPSLYQNKTGPHYYLSYIVDSTHWEKWFYPGFVDRDMRSIQKNATTPTECPQITTLADYCWNPKAYDADRSIKRGLDNYAGKGLFELLKSVHPQMCYYDKYKYGRTNTTMMWEDPDRIRKDIADMERVTAQARELVGTNFFNSLGSWNSGIEFVKSALANVLKFQAKDLRTELHPYLTNNVNTARVVFGYEEGRDVLLDGLMFCPIGFTNNPEQRRGDPLPTSRIAANFLAPVTGTGRFQLAAAPQAGEDTILGLVAYGATPLSAKIELNGKTIFDGRLFEFELEGNREFPFEIVVPAGSLKAGENTLAITPNKQSLELVVAVIKSRPLDARIDRVFGTLGMGGFRRTKFGFAGAEGTLVEPKVSAEGKPWVWIMGETIEENAAAKALLEAGYALVTLDDAKKGFAGKNAVLNRDLFRRRFHRYLVARFGLNEKCRLLSGTKGAEEVLGYTMLFPPYGPSFVAALSADLSKIDFATFEDCNHEGLKIVAWRLAVSKLPILVPSSPNLEELLKLITGKYKGHLTVEDSPSSARLIEFFGPAT